MALQIYLREKNPVSTGKRPDIPEQDAVKKKIEPGKNRIPNPRSSSPSGHPATERTPCTIDVLQLCQCQYVC
jgi:hypothetical protein